ncbi:MAG TPA: CBS domain-containing protein [Jiangellaceae bacterium]|jgi:CBS domain-containing protein|nr:CBS domain-containing protein [Jiangellaceae bacterium]
MSGTLTRVYAARLAGTAAFDPLGDQVGKVHDVVVSVPLPGPLPSVLGLVVEVPVRRRIFLPITRVTSIDAGQVITTGVVNMRRFEQRQGETLVLREMLDRRVVARATGEEVTVSDIGIEQTRARDWVVTKVAAHGRGKRFGRRGETRIYDWDDLSGFAVPEDVQGAANLLAAFDKMRPADLASVLRELSSKRRREVALALDDERLADVMEELDASEAQELIATLDGERAADVLEAMAPDDAADLLSDLPTDQAETLLTLMEPDEAAPVRQLLTYEDYSAGGMMTNEPVVLSPDATVAEALARVRQPELTPSLAAMVYVCRPPMDTPTGRYLGIAHFQRLLREAPSSLVSGVLDTDLDPLPPGATLEQVAGVFATYNLVACPVVDEDGRLLGVVTVDDVLDHLLGEEWRGRSTREGADSGT